MISIGLTLAAAVANIRHQSKHYLGRPDTPDHPLLVPDDEDHGWTQLTAEQAAALDRHHREQNAA